MDRTGSSIVSEEHAKVQASVDSEDLHSICQK